MAEHAQRLAGNALRDAYEHYAGFAIDVALVLWFTAYALHRLLPAGFQFT